MAKSKAHGKLSKEIVDAVCQEISRGVPIRHACTIGGIAKETYYNWKKKAREERENCSDSEEDLEKLEQSLYQYFDKESEKAVALAIASRVEHIRLDNSWQSSAWWLERMAHEDFGKKQTIDANVSAKVKSEDISKFFDDEKVSKILDEEKE